MRRVIGTGDDLFTAYTTDAFDGKAVAREQNSLKICFNKSGKYIISGKEAGWI